MNNVTEEVQRLLDDQNVKYRLVKELGKDTFYLNYSEHCGGYTKAICVEGACITAEISYLLPGEAVTLILDNKKAKSHPYGYEPDTGAFDVTRCECGCLNDISATYCNDCGGEIEVDMNAEKEIYITPLHFVYAIKHDDGSLEFDGKRYMTATLGGGKLTAEQVRDEIERHSAWVIGNNRCFHNGAYEAIADELNATLGTEINGDTSDGYHTFNELYHHRAVLFSVVVAANSGRAWKSKLHHDGTMYDGMFIVGVDTPQGQATYHYNVEPYWDMFWCKELERAPEWDGHTPDDAIERIGSLRDVVLKGPRGRR